MKNAGTRQNRGNGVVVALVAALLAGCAPAAVNGGPVAVGERPRDDANTRAASVALAQAALSEGEAARASYEESLAAALRAIEADPTNPRAYLLAGQASVGAEQWVRADTMFARAEDLNPGYADQIVAERDEAWVLAYSLGVESMNEGDHESALARFQGSDRMFQARPEARIALGILHSQLGNTDAAVEAYRGALDILEQPAPDWLDDEQVEAWAQDRQATTLTLANLLGQAERFEEAADVLSRFLDQSPADLDPEQRLQAMTARAAFLAQAGRTDEAEALYEELLTEGELGANEYFQIGIGLFNADEYARAADAFANSARLNPYSRDAHLNRVQAHFAAASDLEDEPASPARDGQIREHYTALLEAADRVSELDPLNRNLRSFQLRAYRALADISDGAEAERYTRTTQDVFREYQQQEYDVSDIGMALTGEAQAVIQGVFTNLSGTAGSSVELRFTMLDVDGNVIDTTSAHVTVPGVNEAVEFSAEVDLGRGLLAGWSYELVN